LNGTAWGTVFRAAHAPGASVCCSACDKIRGLPGRFFSAAGHVVPLFRPADVSGHWNQITGTLAIVRLLFFLFKCSDATGIMRLPPAVQMLKKLPAGRQPNLLEVEKP